MFISNKEELQKTLVKKCGFKRILAVRGWAGMGDGEIQFQLDCGSSSVNINH